ncbi:MAG TPA: Fic family protein [Acidobacteriaceae bacterium]|nr:Fic family protein [Acidobacteriaceae bacterium]
MILEGYAAFDDPYVYKGATVLKNRLGIRDQETLEAFEVEMSTLRAEEPMPSGRFDAAHYRKIHHFLFQDVYRWAGRYRTVRMAKDQNVFCYPEHISEQMDKLFEQLNHGKLLRTDEFPLFAERAANFLGTLNAIHPFREGNGRTQLAFLGLVAVQVGHPLCLDRIKQETFLPAMVASFTNNLAPLIAELMALRA